MDLLTYVFNPSSLITFSQFGIQILTVAGFTNLYSFIHKNFLNQVIPEAKYFLVHTITNGIIVYFSYECFFEFFQDPFKSTFCLSGVCKNQIPNLLTFSIHIYHMLNYKMKPIDLIHHYPSFIGNIINIVYPSGPLQNYTFMFIMGVPGMIDYGLLTLVKYKKIDKNFEKKINSCLNLYIRSPGLLISSFSLFQSLVNYQNLFVSSLHKYCSFAICIHNFWNAQYFMEKTLRSQISSSF